MCRPAGFDKHAYLVKKEENTKCLLSEICMKLDREMEKNRRK